MNTTQIPLTDNNNTHLSTMLVVILCIGGILLLCIVMLVGSIIGSEGCGFREHDIERAREENNKIRKIVLRELHNSNV
jgi:hypothetical protein